MHPFPNGQIRQKRPEILSRPLPGHRAKQAPEFHPLFLPPGKAGQLLPSGIGSLPIQMDALPCQSNQLGPLLWLLDFAAPVQARQGIDSPQQSGKEEVKFRGTGKQMPISLETQTSGQMDGKGIIVDQDRAGIAQLCDTEKIILLKSAC